MKEINEIDKKEKEIEEALQLYKTKFKDWKDTQVEGTACSNFNHSDIESLIGEYEMYMKNFQYIRDNIKLGEKKDSAKESADAAYKQAEQSSMMYNLSVSSIVNLCAGILILIFFLGKESGLTIKGMKASTAKARGVKAPAMKAPGMKAPGMKAPGVKAPSMKAPGIKPPGVKAPGMKPPGVKAPGMKPPAMKAII